MIQRKQTLFLAGGALLSLLLLFVPNHVVTLQKMNYSLCLMPPTTPDFIGTLGFNTAVAINFLMMVLSFLAIFLYKKRELQVKLSYGICLLGLVLAAMCQFCPFVVIDEQVSGVKNTFVGLFIGLSIALFGFMAQFFIKKDIELLKSADRIR